MSEKAIVNLWCDFYGTVYEWQTIKTTATRVFVPAYLIESEAILAGRKTQATDCLYTLDRTALEAGLNVCRGCLCFSKARRRRGNR
jgi:hypothetical protein